jgi:hypothetical protein
LSFEFNGESGATTKSRVSTLVSKYAPISCVILEKESLTGYIKFKKPVASQVYSFIIKDGGLMFDEEPIVFRIPVGNYIISRIRSRRAIVDDDGQGEINPQANSP